MDEVIEFYEEFKQIEHINEYPAMLTNERSELKIDILQEEVNELKDAYKNYDIVSTVDALCDIRYVLDGIILEHGLLEIFDKCYKEVHRSNMSKLDENGEPLFREDGKIMKSNLYIKPDLRSIIIDRLNEQQSSI